VSRVGVLALQGAFEAHAKALTHLGHEVVEVRDAAQLDPTTLDGLVLPGGESSTHLKIIDRNGLRAPLDAFVRSGRPVLATCAGLILAARHVTHPEQWSFGWLDVDVARNAWGRQVHSFEAVSDAPLPGDEGPLPLIFIRAPRITAVGPAAEVLATFEGEPILVRQGAVHGATFHPELTPDLRLHRRVFAG
jgi:5'-phosphate synthase pdxT subunit